MKILIQKPRWQRRCRRQDTKRHAHQQMLWSLGILVIDMQQVGLGAL